MKKIITLAFAVFPALVWAQDNSFVVKIKVGSAEPAAKAYLNYLTDGKIVKDSAKAVDNAFLFKGVIAEPAMAQLVLDHQGAGLSKLGRNADVKMMFLEKGHIDLTTNDSVKNAVFTGSKLNEEYVKLAAFTAAPDKAMVQVNIDYNAATADQKNNPDYVNGLQARFTKAQEDKKSVLLQFAKQNPSSYISLMALTEAGGQDIDVAAIEPLYKNLSADVRGTSSGKAFEKSIDAARATSVGAMAPLFTQNDVNDKPVSLADFKGKYVLLDFWASWCGPCRGENPNVVTSYKKYKDKNFTVLGVSLDRPGNKEQWLSAIKTDGLEWTQISDLKFWDNDVAKLYGIKAIPQNYLIDPSGKIIGKNLRGDDLMKKLAAILD
ncbi:AhpC/TSA family protein [Mucilaginibacter corticis]|uniref:AhpC/TSA family protein n=1 Tax=Mucilaginibacter corticis TaxID=2597670 RepID=A0A556M934_9SPHI|nr:TlpA disulfide reductase family protein [Mucilaginibacter corticis]TSJ36419.1 AhpC/TSA family protein [Mucilaginibacter corticis]